MLTLPTTPTGLASSNTSGGFTLNWNAASGANSYKVYRDGVPLASNISGTNHEVTGLSPNTYMMQISAVNAGGESSLSNSLSVTVSISGTQISWVTKQAVPDPRRDSSFAVWNSRLYLFGGGYRIPARFYSPSTNNWSSVTNVPGNGVDEGWGATVGSKIYMASNSFDNILRIYDPQADSWSTGADWPNAGNYRLPTAGVIGSEIYVVGGATGGLDASAATRVYNPQSNTWSVKANIQTPRWGAASAVYNGKLYVFGGNGGSSSIQSVEVYDPGNNSWQYLTPVPRARYMGRAVVVNNKIYVIAGFNGSQAISNVDMYDPSNDTWQTASPITITIARYGFSIGVINNQCFRTKKVILPQNSLGQCQSGTNVHGVL